MKQVSIAALALALALGGAAVTPAMAKDKEPKAAPAAKASDAIMKAGQPIQAAVDKKDWATVKTGATALVPQVQTPTDKLYVGNWLVQAGQATKDEAALSQGIDLMLESGQATNAGQLYYFQGQFAYQAKDYPKAVKSLQAAIAAGYTADNLFPLLFESMRLQGQKLELLQLLTDLDAKSAGKPLAQEWYERGFTIAYDAKPTDANYAQIVASGLALSEKWAAAYPQAKVWFNVSLLYRKTIQEDADMKLDIYRFLLASNALLSANDYLEYVEAVYLRYPGEAKAVLDAGVKSGKLTIASNRNASEINQIVTTKIPADKASLAASEKSARAGANAKSALATADAYYGYADYAKAADLYAVAGTKGADANLVALRIGEAQFRAGDTAAAKASFAKVTGPRKTLADFWTIVADHPVTQ